MSEWIKTSERMPEPTDKRRVCVYTPSKDPVMAFRLIDASLFKRVCTDATHWYYVEYPQD